MHWAIGSILSKPSVALEFENNMPDDPDCAIDYFLVFPVDPSDTTDYSDLVQVIQDPITDSISL